MKKTLVALAVAAFATSASALTVYENEGTKVDFDGSLRLLLDNSGSKTKTYTGSTVTTKKSPNHSNLRNDGSRFGVRVKHDLADDLFAFGRLEFRFNGNSTKLDDNGDVVANNTTDSFGNLYAHRAYVGIGSKQFGEVSFGRQVTIGDDISQAGFDNTYGVTKTPLTTDGKAVVRYDYKGIDGLQVGVDYRFAEERENGEVVDGGLKSGYGAGVIYGFDITQGQSAKVAAGYTRDNYKATGDYKHHEDAFMIGGKYTIQALTLALDYGFDLEKDGAKKSRTNGFNVGAKYQFTPAIAAYGNYVYLHTKNTNDGKTTSKEKAHRFMLGTEYQIHKNVFTFVEGRIQKTNTYNADGVKTTSKRDNAVGVGLRVFW